MKIKVCLMWRSFRILTFSTQRLAGGEAVSLCFRIFFLPQLSKMMFLNTSKKQSKGILARYFLLLLDTIGFSAYRQGI